MNVDAENPPAPGSPAATTAAATADAAGATPSTAASTSAIATATSTTTAEEEENAPVMYHCDYCRKDISGGIRIKCAVCTDFDLCVECFSVGVEVTPHQNDHAYQVMDRVNFPLFDEEWEAEEELLLLEAIAKYGLGNWEDVADHVGTKTLAECRDHYFAAYIDTATCPLPDTTRTLTTAATLQARKREADQRALSAATKKRRNKKLVRPDANAVQESSKTLPGQRPASPPPQQQPVVGVPGGAASSAAAGNSQYASAPVSLDLAGFMPLRLEFETEFFNDAEEIISPLTFDDDDTSEEREAKFRLLELYNRKLAERYARRGFVIDRQLMHVKKLLQREKELERDDRDTYGRLRIFMQVLTRADFDQFVDGIIHERRYRRRIAQFQTWRQAGCRTVAAGERFADDVKRRAAEGGRKRPEVDQAAAAAAIAAERRRKLDLLTKWYHKAPKQRKTAPLPLADLPGTPLLTMREAELCSELRIYPKQYLLAKDTLVRLNAQFGALARTQMRSHIMLDPAIAARIFDFCESAGWLKPADAHAQLRLEAQQAIAAMQAAAAAAAAATASTSGAAAATPTVTTAPSTAPPSAAAAATAVVPKTE